MNDRDSEQLEKIRQQFDFGPYPRIPIDADPKAHPGALYHHSLVTSFYLRNRKVINPVDKTILDVGCGTGYTSLILAEANPGARVIGIDISEKSIALAKERAAFHHHHQLEFHVLPIEELPSLEQEFDYINCDEVLYLIPNPERALKNMKDSLKTGGIIRANLHNSAQRHLYYDAQRVFGLLGLMDKKPERMEIEVVQEIMESLKDNIVLKALTWSNGRNSSEESILANYLLRCDRGYNVQELFSLMQEAGLEFISMIDWREWNLRNLFKEPDDLPVFLGLTLSAATIEEELHIFNLLHPVHRLLDFWCGHPSQSETFVPIEEWTNRDWQNCTVHLHPQAQVPQFKEELRQCLRDNQVFPLAQLIPIPGNPPVGVDVTVAACLFPPLLESPQPLSALLQRWKQLKPLNLETFEPLTDDEALAGLKDTLTGFEEFGYLLLEPAG